MHHIAILGTHFAKLGINAHFAHCPRKAHNRIVGIEIHPFHIILNSFALDDEYFILLMDGEACFFAFLVGVYLTLGYLLHFLDLHLLGHRIQHVSRFVQQLLNALLRQ
ncbi:hypothetical protein D3C78_1469200 [compost metagenome]